MLPLLANCKLSATYLSTFANLAKGGKNEYAVFSFTRSERTGKADVKKDMVLYVLYSMPRKETGPAVAVADLLQQYERLRAIQRGRVPGRWVSAMQLADQLQNILASREAKIELPPESADLPGQVDDFLTNAE